MLARLLLAMFLLFQAPNLFAQTQRLAISLDGVSIPGGGSGSAPSYCLDYSRHAPHSGTTLSSVLSGGDSTIITTPTRSFTLSEGIRKGYVSLHGTDIDLLKSYSDPQLIERMSHAPPEVRAEFEQEKALVEGMSPAERRDREAKLSRMLGGGNYSRVTIKNNLSEPIRFKASETVQAGETWEPPVGNLPSLPGTVGAAQQRDLNDRIWHARTTSQQNMLTELGFHKGAVDGKFGPGTERSVEAFQKSVGLDPTGDLDAVTERLLTDQSQAHRLNRNNAHATTVSMRWDAQDGYTLTTAAGTQRFKNPELMAKAVFQRVDPAKSKALYIDLDGMSPKDADALAATLQIHVPDRAAFRITPLIRGEEGPMIRDLLMSPGVEITSVDRAPTNPLEATVNLRRTWLGRPRNVPMRLVTKLSDVMDTAIGRLRDLLPGKSKMSVADALEETKAMLRGRYQELSDEDFQAFIGRQAGGVQIIELEICPVPACS